MNLAAISIAVACGIIALLTLWAIVRWLSPWLIRRRVDGLSRKIKAGETTKPRRISLGHLIVSLAFTIGGLAMVLSGDRFGWAAAIFFGLCTLVCVLEPFLPQRDLSSEYRATVTRDFVACEHPRRNRESIRWEQIRCVSVVTTSDGPWRPDMWLLLEGEAAGCSLPTEAKGFDKLFDQLSARFPGFDFKPFIEACGSAHDRRYVCWQRAP